MNKWAYIALNMMPHGYNSLSLKKEVPLLWRHLLIMFLPAVALQTMGTQPLTAPAITPLTMYFWQVR